MALLLLGALAAPCWGQEENAAVAKQLQSIVQDQAKAWNRGDIDAFMQAYWKSDQLSFSSGGKVTRGWQATKQGYQRRYPDRETMGQLTFSDLEVGALGDEAALMLGKWRLQRDQPLGGVFSLVFRKIQGQWKIVHDHTSVLE